MRDGAALGLVPHTGWAWLVRVRGGAVELRARLVAREVVDGEIYHLAEAMDPTGDAARTGDDLERFVAERRALAVRQATRAIAGHAEGAGAAIVVGKASALPPLPRILAAHPRIHGAEGELWRAVFAEACTALGLEVTRQAAADVRENASRRHGAAALAVFLAAGRQAAGPPWTREVMDAALAAWCATAGEPQGPTAPRRGRRPRG